MITTKQESVDVIFECSPKIFIKRVLRISIYYFCLWFALFVLPLFSDFEVDGLLVSWWLLISIVFLVIPLTFSIKWARFQLISVLKRGETLHFKILDRDQIREMEIEIVNLKSLITWTSGKPKSLILTIYNREDKAIQLYSGAIQSIEELLEGLHYKLTKK